MYLHANAKLGLAGRLALVRAIDQGCSRQRRTGGGIAGSMVAGKRVRLLIARAGRIVRRGCSLRNCSSGSAIVAARLVGVLGWSRA